MAVHLKKSGWHLTACGLSGERNTDDKKTDCVNCRRFMAAVSFSNAWTDIRPALRVFYVRRAGLSVEKGKRVLRKPYMKWLPSERVVMRRQLQSNPVAARLMGVEHREIWRGGVGDALSRHAEEWRQHSVRERLKMAKSGCPLCGAVA